MGDAELTRFRRVLVLSTSPALLEAPAVGLVIAITTLFHILTSPDLGFGHLWLRIPLAALSVTPVVPIVWLAQRMGRRTTASSRARLVLLAYVVSGAVRGALLEAGLAQFHLHAKGVPDFRTVSGIFLVTITALVVSYGWSTMQSARRTIADLQRESDALESTLHELRAKSRAETQSTTTALRERMTTELLRAASADFDFRPVQLQQLVDEVVRPLSREFAREVDVWAPEFSQRPRVTLRMIWRTLDPLAHLPAPLVGVVAVNAAAITSSVALFGWQRALVVQLVVTASLLVSMVLVFSVARRLIVGLPTLVRDVLIAASFLLTTIPPAYLSTIALRGTRHPYTYLLPAILVVPTFAWLIMTGGAARARVYSLSTELSATRDRLKWSVARANLLAWYHQGVMSRLLHGPIQNNIQVGIMRLRATDAEADATAVIIDVVNRIQGAIADALDQSSVARSEVAAMTDVADTWSSVIDGNLDITPECRAALSEDPAAASIVVDLIQEACSNAVRHAGATNVLIECRLGDAVVHVSIEDDGAAYSGANQGAGVGTQLLEACSLELRRTRRDGRNFLEIEIPIEMGVQPSH